jgi:L-aspartate oxidase
MNDLLIPPRFLSGFDPRSVSHRLTDVLVIGSGLAGMRSALEIEDRFQVTLVTKGKSEQSNSQWAQGGIAAVWDPEDTFAAHVEDTLEAGKGLCDRPIVEMVVRDGPERVRELIGWGTIFDKEGGHVSLGLEGGHTHSRILHAHGDATGVELVRALLGEITKRRNIRVLEDTFTLDLLVEEGRCRGALTWHPQAGFQAIWAQETILATGGCGQLFRETTNPPVATGDGIAAAYRAGAVLAEMEFMQFHPTVLYVAGAARTLVTEAVRGEGAYLRDSLGHRFMPDFHPLAELAPRDVVSQAIVKQMQKTNHPCVYLDLAHLDGAVVRRRFPGIVSACTRVGLNFASDRIPVRPGAHYMVGGVRTDSEGRSSLPGLWACGEVSSSGLHGANRLASNSLLEALVFGQRCGVGASRRLRSQEVRQISMASTDGHPPPTSEPLDLADIRNALRSVMFRDVGIERSAESLVSAREQVLFWSQLALTRQLDSPAGWELQNLLTIALLVINAALERTESRGTHFRSDFPTSDETWRVHLTCQRGVPGFQRVPVRDDP